VQLVDFEEATVHDGDASGDADLIAAVQVFVTVADRRQGGMPDEYDALLEGIRDDRAGRRPNAAELRSRAGLGQEKPVVAGIDLALEEGRTAYRNAVDGKQRRKDALPPLPTEPVRELGSSTRGLVVVVMLTITLLVVVTLLLVVR
jgi:hypothetical protein